MVNVPSCLNSLKVDDLDVKLKTVPLVMKNASNVVSKEVVNNTKFNKLNMKVNNLENKILDGTSLIINQYNTDKKGLEKKTEDIDKKNT